MDTQKKPRRLRDPMQLAKMIADIATGEIEDKAPDPYEGKNPHTVEMGKLRGKKGGPARAKKLSSKKRSEIAKKAAKVRWGKKA